MIRETRGPLSVYANLEIFTPDIGVALLPKKAHRLRWITGSSG